VRPVELELSEGQRRQVAELVAAWVRRHHPGRSAGRPVVVRRAEVVVPGRPGIVDVLAEVGGRTAHAVLGVRRPGQAVHLLRPTDEPVAGLLDDRFGLGVAVDALRDAELAALVLSAVMDEPPADAPVSLVADEPSGVVLAFGDRCTLTVFPWLAPGPDPAVETLVALDEAGYNHLAAPLALWRRDGRDLGVVQEALVGGTAGWALALTSLRDLYASGGPPEEAGGDFGPEARALGTMTARLHLALDRAFGRQPVEVAAWVDEARARIAGAEPSLLERREVADTLAALGGAGVRLAAVRTHGDLHLGRTARTDQGWVLADCAPGGVPPGRDAPTARSPLADVADLLWSLHRVAVLAAAERDPTGRSGLASLARAWEVRNRRAFLAGYLATPGIGGIVPADREMVRDLTAVFELERAAGSTDERAGQTGAGPPGG